jgi:hypothetical protein
MLSAVRHIVKQRCVVSIAELQLHLGMNLGKLEGGPKDVDVATDVTRAELVLVIKSFYTRVESPSSKCCDFHEIECIRVDPSIS